MACYISSIQNRHYSALEAEYGRVSAVAAANRVSTVSLKAEMAYEKPRRRDKTGTRTFLGITGELKRRTSFELTTYLYGRDSGSAAPSCGPLLQAGLGGAPRTFQGGLSISSAAGLNVTFGQPHGLTPGQAVTFGNELRLVSAVPGPESVVLSAPFTGSAGVAGGTVTYEPAFELPSVSLYDYWSPESAAQRILAGAAVDEIRIRVNGDFHELRFKGGAANLIDRVSFESGAGGLTQFPAEPAVAAGAAEMPVPGHLGQAWLGGAPTQVHTMSSAEVRIQNGIELRARDYGSLAPRCIVPGDRTVTVALEMYSLDGGVFDEVLQAARSRSPVPLMLQLGERAGQLCGVYMPNFVPAVPQFIDDEPRLRWRLEGSQAVGVAEDEIYVAFG
jgi:hypothetical protein